MLRSMTGFGRAELLKGGLQITAEVLSLNSRFLDITCRLPRQLSSYEWRIRELICQYLSRGAVTVTVSLRWQEPVPRSFSLPLAQAYYAMLQHLAHSLGLSEEPRLEHLLRFPDIFDPSSTESNEEELWPQVQRVLRRALQQLQRMRRAEGKNLSSDIRQRLRTVAQLVSAIERRNREHIPQAQQQLQQRIAQLLRDIPDPHRLSQEFALLADRLDVSEECTRLRSHLQLMRQLLQERSPVGRRLVFLLQEMQREANTIGAKANNAQISQLVVQLKEELERLREQAQNVE